MASINAASMAREANIAAGDCSLNLEMRGRGRVASIDTGGIG